MSELLETFEEGVLTLTINRPKARNTLSVPISDALKDALHLEAENVVRTMQTDDHKHAAAAFLDKKAPIFQGR